MQITELPIGVWTEDYKLFLENLINKKNSILKDFKDMSTDTNVDITITLTKGSLMNLISKISEYGCSHFEKKFKLYTSRAITNMHLFDFEQKMKRYRTTEEIIDEWYPLRYNLYVTRKAHMLKVLEEQVKILHNKSRFIEEQCNNTLDLRNQSRAATVTLLKEHEYELINNEYKYLVSMPISCFMQENITDMRTQRDKKKADFDYLKNKTIIDMWLEELKIFVKKYKSIK